MKWTQPLFDAIDQLRGLLPLAALAAVAGYTWWLVQSAPQAGDAAKAAPLASPPDYELTGAMVERFDPTGARVTILRGSRMSHYPVGDRLAVVSPQLVGLDEAVRGADLVITGGSLQRIPQAIDLARRTRSIIRQNLGWAIGYNLLALPLAALGMVTPWIAALGMALSSLLVTLNALRLARGVRR